MVEDVQFLKECAFRRAFNSNKQSLISDKGPINQPRKEEEAWRTLELKFKSSDSAVRAAGEVAALELGEPASCLTTGEWQQYLPPKDTAWLR